MPEEKLVDIKSAVKQIALDSGVDSEVAIQIAEKCYADIPVWRPYGGATSFAQIDQMKQANAYSQAVDDNTYALQAIITNITSNDELDTADAKANAIKQVADDYRSRVNALSLDQYSNKSVLESIKEFIFGEKRSYSSDERDAMAKNGQARPDGSYPIKDTTDLKNAIRAWGRGGATAEDKAHIIKRARALGATDQLPDDWTTSKKEVGLTQGFKVFEDTKGNLRWITFSSNAFEDLDRELFTTKALEEAVEYADKSDERGPLLVFHVPGAEIGQCDYQAVQGRFLIESGTFNDTPLGQKAVQYFADSEEEFQVSIGFQYKEGDDLDGQYDWLRIKERSVLPAGTAANPWTDFKVIGEESLMDARKEQALKDIFGSDLATGIISAADTRTKELETKNIKFKEQAETDSAAEPITITVTGTTPEEIEASFKSQMEEKAKKTPAAMAEDAQDGGKDDDKEDENGKIVKGKEASVIDGEKLASLLGDLIAKVDQLAEIPAAVESLKAEVKEIKTENSPRFSTAFAGRPSEDASNVLDEAKAKVFTGEKEEIMPNPAMAYVRDLFPAATN